MFDHLKKITFILKKLPDNPGIYLFYSAKKELIYVGKATSLKGRVRSYFRSLPSVSPLGQGRTMAARPIEQMMHEVADIQWKETDSVLEAIILEAEHIKKFQPKYNIEGKDDKSWNYIVITRDEYPKVVTMRQREHSVIARSETTKQSSGRSGYSGNKASPESSGIATSADANRLPRNDKYVFGPFPGLNTKVAMKLLRRMFGFSNCHPPTVILSETKNPLKQTQSNKPKVKGSFADAQDDKTAKPCLYRQMGWCPGVCTGEISPREYRRQVIRPLVTFLSGRKKQVIKMFETEMKRASHDERFEDAARLRDQLKSLQRIQDVALLNKSFVEDSCVIARSGATSQSPGLKQSLKQWDHDARPKLARDDALGLRIEGYDISNLGAFEKVGSMVVFNHDGPVKSEYRKFIIKTVSGQSDVDSLAEVITRRLTHTEWPFPNVFLIDGGRPQVNRIKHILEVNQVTIPVVGIAKGPERKRNDFILGNKNREFISWVTHNKQLLIQARDEAHRFAVMFHRQRRARQVRSTRRGSASARYGGG